jgi:hypothetical protein
MKPSMRTALLIASAAAGCQGAVLGGGTVSESSAGFTAGAVYNFGTLAHPGACMDAQGAGTANGTQIQEWWCNGTGAQAFSVENAGGAYALVNPRSGKCVDVAARGTANGTKIQLYDCNQTPAQAFRLEAAQNGFVTIVNTNSGKCLDVAGDNPADGTVVQLYDCNGTNAQLWNPALISGAPPPPPPPPPPVGGSGVRVHVTNHCPVDLWIHGAGTEATLQPDNAHLAPNTSQDYVAPFTWSNARIYGFLSPPDAHGNPQGQNDKIEMNFFNKNGVESLNTDITYVDWVALPSRIEAVGSGGDCTTVGCEVPYAQLLAGCPPSLLSGHECLSAGAYCLDPNHAGDPFCHVLDGQVAACAAAIPACAGGAGSSTAQVYSCSGGFFAQSPEYCAALNRGVLDAPGRDTPASAFYQNGPFNAYSKWVHETCPGIYAFPYDDYGSSNQSSDHTCSGATQLNLTFCPQG